MVSTLWCQFRAHKSAVGTESRQQFILWYTIESDGVPIQNFFATFLLTWMCNTHKYNRPRPFFPLDFTSLSPSRLIPIIPTSHSTPPEQHQLFIPTPPILITELDIEYWLWINTRTYSISTIGSLSMSWEHEYATNFAHNLIIDKQKVGHASCSLEVDP